MQATITPGKKPKQASRNLTQEIKTGPIEKFHQPIHQVAGAMGIDMMVVFQKWRWPCLHCPSKGIAVDKQAKDDVMHLGRFRKADGLAGQAFNARP